MCGPDYEIIPVLVLTAAVDVLASAIWQISPYRCGTRIGRGTDSAVYRAAGEVKLLAERKKIGDITPGDAAVTPSFQRIVTYFITSQIYDKIFVPVLL